MDQIEENKKQENFEIKNSENQENEKQEVGDPTYEELAHTGVPFIDALTLQDLLERPMLSSSLRYHVAYGQRVQALAVIEAKQKSRALIESRLRRMQNKTAMKLSASMIHPESDVTMKDEGAPAMVPIETYVEEAKPAATTVTGSSFAPLNDGQDQQYSLQGFFQRPVLIDDGLILLNVETLKIYNIWDLWSKNPTIRSKLTNFAYFRGNLTVRIAISGTPFHYGMFMVAYYPYGVKNDVLQAYLSALPFPANSYLYPAFKTYMSQCPGVAYIDVKENEPLEVNIPFMWHKQKACLYNKTLNTTITNATSYDDLSQMGQLILISLNKPKMARDDTTTNLSYNIYAFADGVELSVPTSTDINIVAEARVGKKKKKSAMYEAGPLGGRVLRTIEQAGSEFDSPGPIEKVATSISKAGDALSNLPYVGAFAKATSVATGAIAKFASFFGLSRIPVITAPTYVYNRIYQNGANVVANDTVLRLTIDPKQEVSIEQALEEGEDCMTISHIASRESYLTTVPWVTDDPAGTEIWRACVTPLLNSNVAPLVGGTQYLSQPTAMSFAVAPFMAWRGKLHFRIEVVCSQFHRGKLLIRYEPNLFQKDLIMTAGLVLTQQNSMSIDIQETQELVFTVDWAAERPFCVNKVSSFAIGWADIFREDGTREGWHPDSFASDADARAGADSVNGFIYIAPINDLVEPDLDQPVYINIYTWATDLITTVPREYDQVFDAVNNRNIVPESDVSINPTAANNMHVLDDHYGEQVTSFRTLLKRYSLVGTRDLNVNSARSPLNALVVRGTRYPSGGTRYRFSPASAADTGYYSPANWFNYLRYAYLGMRGAYRYRVRTTNARSTYTMAVNPSRNGYTATPATATYDGFVTGIAFVDLSTASSDTSPLLNGDARGIGSADYHTQSNAGIEFEVPYYDRNLFLLSCNYNPTDLPNYTGEESNHTWGTVTYTGRYLEASDIANGVHHVTIHASSGEDFTFLRFQGAPFTNYVV